MEIQYAESRTQKAKKKVVEEDEDDKAFKAKQAAGKQSRPSLAAAADRRVQTRRLERTWPRRPVAKVL